MRKLTLGVMLLAILLFGGCAQIGQPAPSYPAPGASQPDKRGNGGTDGGGEM
jgi:hypothetical protein